jgi:hypothetical protein
LRTSTLPSVPGSSPQPIQISAYSAPTPVLAFSSSTSLTAVECPFKEGRSREGIIRYLTLKHSGNVHDREIVTITSKSVYDQRPELAVRNVADLARDSSFSSKYDPGQWVRWDFGERRVRLFHYTIWSKWLKSWVIEGSMDGLNWAEVDRRTENDDLKVSPNIASFALANPMECTFIRLTQTGESRPGGDQLRIWGVEFFGAILE